MYEKIAHLALKYRSEKGGIEVSSDSLREMTNNLAKVIRDRLDKPILPETGETIAIASNSPKTAALFFDRVWYPIIDIDPPPKGIGIYGATELEVWLEAIVLFFEKEDLSEKKVQKLFLDTAIAKYIATYGGTNIDVSRIIA